jgi:hypothetical protein
MTAAMPQSIHEESKHCDKAACSSYRDSLGTAIYAWLVAGTKGHMRNVIPLLHRAHGHLVHDRRLLTSCVRRSAVGQVLKKQRAAT